MRQGSDRAFEELYASYRGRIGSRVRGMIGDHQRAKDIAQEVFISALRRLRGSERDRRQAVDLPDRQERLH